MKLCIRALRIKGDQPSLKEVLKKRGFVKVSYWEENGSLCRFYGGTKEKKVPGVGGYYPPWMSKVKIEKKIHGKKKPSIETIMTLRVLGGGLGGRKDGICRKRKK